jgi:hypothetical protein
MPLQSPTGQQPQSALRIYVEQNLLELSPRRIKRAHGDPLSELEVSIGRWELVRP